METVWDFLTDPRRVARCLPGASITDQVDDKTYSGNLSIKVGPVSSSYKGKISFDLLDRAAGRAQITGRGQDVRGRGGADMRMTSQLTQNGAATDVTVSSEVNVTGILAQFGRGMIQDVSDQMFQTFTERMRQELATGQQVAAPAGTEPAVDPADSGRAEPVTDPPQESLDALALGAAVGKRVLGRAIRRPLFWIAVAAGGLISYMLFFR